MKRERALQVVLVLVGLFYCFWGYLLFDDLWHSSRLRKNDVAIGNAVQRSRSL
jgi:hypothetical protein